MFESLAAGPTQPSRSQGFIVVAEAPFGSVTLGFSAGKGRGADGVGVRGDSGADGAWRHPRFTSRFLCSPRRGPQIFWRLSQSVKWAHQGFLEGF